MNEKEFCNFVEETKGIVLAAVRRYLSAQYYQAIDDVVQETYIRAYRGLKLAEFNDRKSLLNWLYTIARNESLRMGEKMSREDMRIARMKQELEIIGTYEKANDGEEIELLKKIIKDLPKKYRDVFELLLLGRSETEISQALLIKKGTVKSRIHRGKDMISRIALRRGVIYE
ncbi:MAG TPA: RNA polymerase sigma factor [Spirochaetota bacterium]|nr:RNA polymerase sigma factor [Spirochaetota bacterium]HPI90721.1 RNA polymerase sigma factor [Spirochaetota bacterium]HPR49742.1 RNA polymerase sigma factor [Spirochaetota bacterium]